MFVLFCKRKLVKNNFGLKQRKRKSPKTNVYLILQWNEKEWSSQEIIYFHLHIWPQINGNSSKTVYIRIQIIERVYITTIILWTDYIRKKNQRNRLYQGNNPLLSSKFETGKWFPECIQIHSRLKKDYISYWIFYYVQILAKNKKYCFQTKAEAYLAVNSAPPPQKGAFANVPIRIFLTVFIVRNIP